MNNAKRILICPLDWGLGHATRCIPIINELLKNKYTVFIAASGRPLELLKQEFPKLGFVKFPGYNIKYGTGRNLAFKIALQAPKILRGIKRENKQLAAIIAKHKIDCVISDNRYGCWNKNVYSIFITHQLNVKSPLFETQLNKIVTNYIKKYNECWVPDFEDDFENLSGDLCHKFQLPENTSFIGPLSRFSYKSNSVKSIDVLVMVSGPEPQRTLFQDLVLEQLEKTKLQTIVACGTPEQKIDKTIGTIRVISHLDSKKLEQVILKSKIVIARSGYSTIMELAKLQAKAIFIPTPGQTEQEYLAKTLMSKKIAFSQQQDDFDLEVAMQESEKYTGFTLAQECDLLQTKIKELKGKF